MRELQNAILRLVALNDSETVEASLLSPRVRQGQANTTPAAPEATIGDWSEGLNGNLRERMEALERRVLLQAMQRHQGNKSRAARELGLSRVGLRAKLTRYGMADE